MNGQTTDSSTTNLTQWLGNRTFDDWKSELDREGFVVFPGALPPTEVARVRDALEPHLEKRGRNNFEGYKTHRVYSLIAKAPEVFSDLVSHPLTLAFAEAELGPSCLLSALLAIECEPGETVQPWHRDDGFLDLPLPRPSFGLSAFWAIDDTTQRNGATEIVPRSHLAADPLHEELRLQPPPSDEQARDPEYDPQPRPDAFKATLSSGSLMLMKGSLLHRGGANRSDHNRLIVTPQYCPGWARQIENMMLSVPRHVALELPQRTRELLGYSLHGTFMGYVDGVHPEKALRAAVESRSVSS